jgi:hypothetical protein
MAPDDFFNGLLAALPGKGVHSGGVPLAFAAYSE